MKSTKLILGPAQFDGCHYYAGPETNFNFLTDIDNPCKTFIVVFTPGNHFQTFPGFARYCADIRDTWQVKLVDGSAQLEELRDFDLHPDFKKQLDQLEIQYPDCYADAEIAFNNNEAECKWYMHHRWTNLLMNLERDAYMITGSWLINYWLLSHGNQFKPATIESPDPAIKHILKTFLDQNKKTV